MSIYTLNTEIFGKQFTPPRKRKTKINAWVKVLLSAVGWNSDAIFRDYIVDAEYPFVDVYSSAVTYVINDYVIYNGVIYQCIALSTGNLPTDVSYFSVATFAVEEKIIFLDRGVYVCILANTGGIAPTADMSYWHYQQTNFIGVTNRIRANAQILKFEFILNKWFRTNFNYPSAVNDVYISNNTTSNAFVFGDTEAESSSVKLTDALQEDFIQSSFSATAEQYTINIPLAVYDALYPSDATGTTTTKDNIVRNFADNYNLAGITYAINPY